MTDSVQKIREALAAEPTTGPWYGNFKGVWCDSECHFDRISRSEGTRGKTEWEERNNNYIASVNPTAIAELLQKLDAALLDAEKLRDFAKEIMDNCPDVVFLDGFDLQDLGVKYGLLVGTIKTEPCSDNCNCAEYGDFPMKCFTKTPLMTGAAVAQQKGAT
jgi:hypothetical protein